MSMWMENKVTDISRFRRDQAQLHDSFTLMQETVYADQLLILRDLLVLPRASLVSEVLMHAYEAFFLIVVSVIAGFIWLDRGDDTQSCVPLGVVLSEICSEADAGYISVVKGVQINDGYFLTCLLSFD